MENFVPLRVSQDDNFCYFESLKYSHSDIADMIASHESFVPTMATLENILSRSKYDIFKKCMNSPHLSGDLMTYRFTFRDYVDNQKYREINDLLQKIKSRECGHQVQINDPALMDPRLAAKIATNPLVTMPDIVNLTTTNATTTNATTTNATTTNATTTNSTFIADSVTTSLEDKLSELEKVVEANPIPTNYRKEFTGDTTPIARPLQDDHDNIAFSIDLTIVNTGNVDSATPPVEFCHSTNVGLRIPEF